MKTKLSQGEEYLVTKEIKTSHLGKSFEELRTGQDLRGK
jgi:hypothetical protein